MRSYVWNVYFCAMIERIKALLEEVAAFTASSADEVEQFRIAFLGKKGQITQLFADFRHVPNEEKKEYGQLLNQLKTATQEKVKALQGQLSGSKQTKGALGDTTRPGYPLAVGALHPLVLFATRLLMYLAESDTVFLQVQRLKMIGIILLLLIFPSITLPGTCKTLFLYKPTQT